MDGVHKKGYNLIFGNFDIRFCLSHEKVINLPYLSFSNTVNRIKCNKWMEFVKNDISQINNFSEDKQNGVSKLSKLTYTLFHKRRPLHYD